MSGLLTKISYIIAFFLLICISSRPIQAESPQDNLIDLSIKELMEIEVTTALIHLKGEIIMTTGSRTELGSGLISALRMWMIYFLQLISTALITTET